MTKIKNNFNFRYSLLEFILVLFLLFTISCFILKFFIRDKEIENEYLNYSIVSIVILGVLIMLVLLAAEFYKDLKLFQIYKEITEKNLEQLGKDLKSLKEKEYEFHMNKIKLILQKGKEENRIKRLISEVQSKKDKLNYESKKSKKNKLKKELIQSEKDIEEIKIRIELFEDEISGISSYLTYFKNELKEKEKTDSL